MRPGRGARFETRGLRMFRRSDFEMKRNTKIERLTKSSGVDHVR